MDELNGKYTGIPIVFRLLNTSTFFIRKRAQLIKIEFHLKCFRNKLYISLLNLYRGKKHLWMLDKSKKQAPPMHFKKLNRRLCGENFEKIRIRKILYSLLQSVCRVN